MLNLLAENPPQFVYSSVVFYQTIAKVSKATLGSVCGVYCHISKSLNA